MDAPALNYVHDDGGRAASGRRGSAGDCAVRAVAIVAGVDYDTVYRAAAILHRDRNGTRTARNGLDKRDTDKLATMFGLRKVPFQRGVRPTLAEAHAAHGDCMASTTGHVCALVGGALRDTRDYRVYGIFTRHPDGTETTEIRERKAMSIWVAA